MMDFSVSLLYPSLTLPIPNLLIQVEIIYYCRQMMIIRLGRVKLLTWCIKNLACYILVHFKVHIGGNICDLSKCLFNLCRVSIFMRSAQRRSLCSQPLLCLENILLFRHQGAVKCMIIRLGKVKL